MDRGRCPRPLCRRDLRSEEERRIVLLSPLRSRAGRPGRHRRRERDLQAFEPNASVEMEGEEGGPPPGAAPLPEERPSTQVPSSAHPAVPSSCDRAERRRRRVLGRDGGRRRSSRSVPQAARREARLANPQVSPERHGRLPATPLRGRTPRPQPVGGKLGHGGLETPASRGTSSSPEARTRSPGGRRTFSTCRGASDASTWGGGLGNYVDHLVRDWAGLGCGPWAPVTWSTDHGGNDISAPMRELVADALRDQMARDGQVVEGTARAWTMMIPAMPVSWRSTSNPGETSFSSTVQCGMRSGPAWPKQLRLCSHSGFAACCTNFAPEPIFHV